MIKNIALKGCGVKGILYAGSLSVLEEKGILQGVERYAGVSAGSIVALLPVIGYNAKEIYDLVNSTDFKSFEDHINPIQLIEREGIHSGNNLLAWVRQVITARGFQADATFRDLHNMGCKDLYVFACGLKSGNVKRFSNLDTPNYSVAQAIRASAGIPIFFETMQFTVPENDPEIYVDGGTVYNYPIDFYDRFGSPSETLGLFPYNMSAPEPDRIMNKGNLLQFGKALFAAMLNSQDINTLSDLSATERTIKLDSLGISATNFSLSDDQKIALYNSGRDATIKHFASLQ